MHRYDHKIQCQECWKSIKFDVDIDTNKNNVSGAKYQNFIRFPFDHSKDRRPFNFELICDHCATVLEVSGYGDYKPHYCMCDECGNEHEIKPECDKNGWFPIESAPKDGTLIDLWNYKSDERYADCWWEDESRYTTAGFFYAEGEVKISEFSHWHPLPEPPEVAE